jgi:hypothetical protein
MVNPPSRVLPVLVLLALLWPLQADAQSTRPRVVIDADTSNEVDDPYAIVRALLAPELDVIALASAHWQSSHWATPTTM